MPIQYTVSTKGTFAYFTATGVLDVPDFEKLFDELVHDERLQPGFCQLLDLTAMSASKLTRDSFRQIIKLVKTNPKTTNYTKLAIVVNSDDSFERARDYEKMAKDAYQDIIVFNSLGTAKIWLGVSENRNGTS